MATYAIGDLQGNYRFLLQLLELVRFDRGRDRLWMVGDLVNRGPDSLASLRFLRDLGPSAVCVLGNHDLHLLCVASGVEAARKGDTLQPVLDAPDREDLLSWLRSRPLLHREGNILMVHAGLLPQWTADRAAELATEVEAVLSGGGAEALLRNLYGNSPAAWSDSLNSWDRLRVIVNAMTRMRLCNQAGVMNLAYKGDVESLPAGDLPWFDVAGRRSADHTIVCGHWSALGLQLTSNLIALDSGCQWGGALTAVRLEDRRVYQVPCTGQDDQA